MVGFRLAWHGGLTVRETLRGDGPSCLALSLSDNPCEPEDGNTLPENTDHSSRYAHFGTHYPVLDEDTPGQRIYHDRTNRPLVDHPYRKMAPGRAIEFSQSQIDPGLMLLSRREYAARLESHPFLDCEAAVAFNHQDRSAHSFLFCCSIVGIGFSLTGSSRVLKRRRDFLDLNKIQREAQLTTAPDSARASDASGQARLELHGGACVLLEEWRPISRK